jgi:hypothetical protein
MAWEITSKVVLCRVKASNDNKIKYYITNQESGKEYVVLHWPGIPCIVYDKNNEDILDSYNWYYVKDSGYVYANIGNKKQISMHVFIMKDSVENTDNTLSVDHINYFKTFNVRENLRYATINQQISNRDTRKDKVGPPKELVDIGVTSLPKHVRYDKTENKFVIERKHPGIEYVDGSFNYSGTKSTNVSIIYKFYDILKKLGYLDKLANTPERNAFLEKQLILYKEYQDICFLITGERPESPRYSNEFNYTEYEQYLTEDEKEYSRRGLPETFTVEKLPEYVCYVKQTDKRGDKFYVSRHHPKLKAAGITDFCTTASKKISTISKYNEIITLLDTINTCDVSELKEVLKIN